MVPQIVASCKITTGLAGVLGDAFTTTGAEEEQEPCVAVRVYVPAGTREKATA